MILWLSRSIVVYLIFNVDAIKIGMLHSADLINVICETLIQENNIINKEIKIILDPVMVAKGGHKLLKDNAISALKDLIKNLRPILTPNIPEAEILTGLKIRDITDMKEAARAIIDLGASQVILKGGHLQTSILIDLLMDMDNENIHTIETNKIVTNDTHGTGCTMASALSAFLVKSQPIEVAFQSAHSYVNKAIKTAPKFGKGNGPINHCHKII